VPLQTGAQLSHHRVQIILDFFYVPGTDFCLKLCEVQGRLGTILGQGMLGLILINAPTVASRANNFNACQNIPK